MNGINNKLLNARNSSKQKKDKPYQITVLAGSEAEPYNKNSVEYELILSAIKPENGAEFTPVFIGKKELEYLPNVKITDGENDRICVYQIGELSGIQITAICVAVAKYTQAETLLFYDKGLTEENYSDYIKRIRNGEEVPEVLKLVESQAKPVKRLGVKEVREYYDGVHSGLFLMETKPNGDEAQPLYLCDKAETLGIGVNEDGDHFTVLKWTATGNNQTLIEPISNEIFGDQEGWKYLKRKGFDFNPNGRAKTELAMFWQQQAKQGDRWHIADKTGWHNGAYVLPNGEVLADKNTNVLLNKKSNKANGYTTSGSIESWRENIARYVEGNPILLLGLGVGLCSPLLSILNGDSFCVHIVGNSSTGKTTSARIALSLWGDYDKTMLSWSGTGYGITNEGLSHNDSLLALDEINQADPKAVKNIAYTLCNEVGKIKEKRTEATAAEKAGK